MQTPTCEPIATQRKTLTSTTEALEQRAYETMVMADGLMGRLGLELPCSPNKQNAEPPRETVMTRTDRAIELIDRTDAILRVIADHIG